MDLEEIREAGRVHGRRDGLHHLERPEPPEGAADPDVRDAYAEGYAEGREEAARP